MQNVEAQTFMAIFCLPYYHIAILPYAGIFPDFPPLCTCHKISYLCAVPLCCLYGCSMAVWYGAVLMVGAALFPYVSVGV